MQCGDRFIGVVLVFHRHEAEAAGASGHAIGDEIDGLNRAVSGEEILEIVLSCIEGKVSYKQFGAHVTEWVLG